VAVEALLTVLTSRHGLEETLDNSAGHAALAPRDRAFARLMASTTLRHLGEIDALLEHCLERPLPEHLQREKMALRCGIAQLIFLETPPHAAVSATVESMPPRLRGLANAVLRRIDRERKSLVSELDPPALALPGWLQERWQAAYGAPAARALAEASLLEAPLDLTLRDPGEADRWAEALEQATGSPVRFLAGGTLRLTRPPGGVMALPGYDEGAWWVQDMAAALPARLLGARGPGSLAGSAIADICAAPGGKTQQLAAAGADVTAIDRSRRRLERLQANLKRTGLAAAIAVGDATTWQPDRLFDAVLIDAPCSATGTLRRHPEVRWTKRAEDIAALASLQARILDQAVSLLKAGGTLLYCTCSLEPEEGENQVEAALARHDALQLDPIKPDELPDIGEMTGNSGILRCLPGQMAEAGSIDGFFIARFRKN
jgi:16S rRNA (cytosine967-C5)-methyltransferase